MKKLLLCMILVVSLILPLPTTAYADTLSYVTNTTTIKIKDPVSITLDRGYTVGDQRGLTLYQDHTEPKTQSILNSAYSIPSSEKDHAIVIDQFYEFLFLNIEEYCFGSYTNMRGYYTAGGQQFLTSKTGKPLQSYYIMRFPFDLWIDVNSDSELVSPTSTELTNNTDDIFFVKDTAVLFRFGTDYNWYVLNPADSHAPILVGPSATHLRVYLCANTCTTGFTGYFGASAANADFGALPIYDYDVIFPSPFDSALALVSWYRSKSQTNDTNPLKGDNSASNSLYAAFATCDYDIVYRYIRTRWYQTNDPDAVVNFDSEEMCDRIVLKQGYSGYVDVLTYDDFDGTINLYPEFKWVDIDTPDPSNPSGYLEKPAHVYYNAYDKKGRLHYGIDASDVNASEDPLADDFTIKTSLRYHLANDETLTQARFDAVGLAVPSKNAPSQKWFSNKVESINSLNSVFYKTINSNEVKVYDYLWSLPSNLTVLIDEDNPVFTGLSSEERNDYVLNHGLNADYTYKGVALPDHGYLLCYLTTEVLNADGSVMIAKGSLPPLMLYYLIGDTALYEDVNGTVPDSIKASGDVTINYIQ